jgi:hypothetical protein
MATQRDLLTSRIIFRAVLPVVKVMLEDDPKMAKRFEGVNAVVQFVAKDEKGPVGAYLKFADGAFEAVPEIADKPDITFSFPSVAKMNAMFKGKPVLPRIKGITRIGLLGKVFSVLLGLKLLMPTAKPKTPELARLKVKMTLYMVSTGLSQLNKAGDPDMVKWTSKQPLRVYQWSCEPEGIACYLKVKAGKTKAGRGYYTRRKPFVHMKFDGVKGALPVLTNSIDTVQAMTQGLVTNDGSPEYGGQVGDFMLRIAALLT